MTDPNVDAETTASPDDSVPFAGLDIEIGPLAYGTARLGEATLDARDPTASRRRSTPA